MGKRQKQNVEMGRLLKMDMFRGQKGNSSCYFHTTEDNNRSVSAVPKVESVTEQTSLDDFLTRSEMACVDFTAIRRTDRVHIVGTDRKCDVLTDERLSAVKGVLQISRNLLRIPRRPDWNVSTTAEQLRELEHISFLEWRRQLAAVKEDENVVVTPYEKNLDFWRQLWRVIERSDVVVQIVDARNPLLFWCPDLDSLVREVDPRKQCILLMNKSDFLTEKQRETWADYFRSKCVPAVFWSAVQEASRLERQQAGVDEDRLLPDENSTSQFRDAMEAEVCAKVADGKSMDAAETDHQLCPTDEDVSSEFVATTQPYLKTSLTDSDQNGVDSDDGDTHTANCDTYELVDPEVNDQTDHHSPDRCSIEHDDTLDVPTSLMDKDTLLDVLRHTALTQVTSGVTTIGMVGYPNVGKSSTINTILRMKKVPVSATPGRTKHFQTLHVDTDLVLCDCPGLVFPSFVNSKADLIINGILSIDQMTDCIPPVDLVCRLVGRGLLQAAYNLNLPPPEPWEDADKPPTAHDLLDAYGLMRGFMSHKGNPDRPRAARYILKDFVNGKLLFCNPPPGVEATAFQKPPYTKLTNHNLKRNTAAKKTLFELKTEKLNMEFFSKKEVMAHIREPNSIRNSVCREGLEQIPKAVSSSSSLTSLSGKPWKYHNNKNKREKLRRVYSDLDKH